MQEWVEFCTILVLSGIWIYCIIIIIVVVIIIIVIIFIRHKAADNVYNEMQ